MNIHNYHRYYSNQQFKLLHFQKINKFCIDWRVENSKIVLKFADNGTSDTILKCGFILSDAQETLYFLTLVSQNLLERSGKYFFEYQITGFYVTRISACHSISDTKQNIAVNP